MKQTKNLQVYAVVVHNVNQESVDYTARWHVVASDVESAIKKVRPKIERGERVMSVHRVTAIDIP
jgi:hypothetical protein